MSRPNEFYRGEDGELIEVRYLTIPGVAEDEVDEIVCGPMHLETLDTDVAYIRVAGLMVNIRAKRGRVLSITCEPDACRKIDPQAEAERADAKHLRQENERLMRSMQANERRHARQVAALEQRIAELAPSGAGGE